eukprot:TRINITY_DN8904_c0_g1_i2.p1 TRINITY_DN8904_c0_g1~~TRINITY_DN8904_c0_g1_i2.p1  ORF type:complete len:2792 (-),score=534.48 TRINITY_DN8904_c0_g1_i2:78-8453(-)
MAFGSVAGTVVAMRWVFLLLIVLASGVAEVNALQTTAVSGSAHGAIAAPSGAGAGCYVSFVQMAAMQIPQAKKKKSRNSSTRSLLDYFKRQPERRLLRQHDGNAGISLQRVYVKHLTHTRLTALDDDVNADICGARLVTPQLQFQMEIYRALGVMRSHYALCRVPRSRNITVARPESLFALGSRHAVTGTAYADAEQHRQDALLGYVNAFQPQEVQAKRAWCFVVFWAAGVVCTILTLMMSAKVRLTTGSLRKGRSPWQMKRFGFALSWLDPIMSLFRSRGVEAIDVAVISALRPDFHSEPQEALQAAWASEVASKGLANASLSAALGRFVGARALLTIFSTVGASMVLELAGMTMVLDLLINYLRWASDVRAESPMLRLETLGPSLMIVMLGFGFPMLARYFGIIGNVHEGYATGRISAGLLALVYEKAQRLPPGEMRAGGVDVSQLVSGDTTKMWTAALKSYAQLVAAPVCLLIYCGLLVRRLGGSGVAGTLAAGVVCLAYVPVRNLVRRQNLRWLSLVDLRTRLTREAIFMLRGVAGPESEVCVVERLLEVRNRELQMKLDFSVVLSLMTVPVALFPLALVCFSLFFHLCFARGHGDGIVTQDIFVCMQVFSGSIACCNVLSSALPRVINLPNSVRRIERFLREPEHVEKPAQEQSRHNDAPVVRVNGSFSFAPSQPPVLHDLDLDVSRGELVALLGASGSGKSTLLSAMLGELSPVGAKSHVDAPRLAAYCAQTPWIADDLLHEAVALGEPLEKERYEGALAAAGLATSSSSRPVRAATVSSGGAVEPSRFPYFLIWNLSAVLVMVLGILNVDWSKTPIFFGVLVVAVQGILHWSVVEIPLQTIAALFVKVTPPARVDARHLTVCLNYNLLAVSSADVDACFENMYDAFMGSVSENVSSVLVSATNCPTLKAYEIEVRDQYRERIYSELVQEGLVWAGLEHGTVDPERERRVWSRFASVNRQEFARTMLNPLCERFAKEFMVLHRVSRVLRKCGQYQDLMLLSAGNDCAFTYCDEKLYGQAARPFGEPLFYPSPDVENVKGRNFDYTLVLDADTSVVPDSVFSLLEVGAAYPERAIIQPAIKMFCRSGDSIYTHVEAMRQAISAPLTDTLTAILGESGFYGKGLINNSRYIETCIGTPEDLLEVVPIDVLSHDTFEAAVVRPLYVGDVALYEAPCCNYVTWDIRERRWNRGELLLSMYFFPNTVGSVMRFLQRCLQRGAYQRTRVRTKPNIEGRSVYLAHAAMRQMMLKPALVLYIVFMDFVKMHYGCAPILIVMFLIIVFPKLAFANSNNLRAVMLETFASVLQFTPESVVGTIRILRALKAHLTANTRWIPQRAVEDDFERSNAFVLSFSYLWYYPVFAVTSGLLVIVLVPEGKFIMWMLGTLLTLPFYAGFTALRSSLRLSSFPFFFLWNLSALVALALAALNIDWDRTNPIFGLLIVVIQGLLHWSVMEFPLQTAATLCCPSPAPPRRAGAGHLKACLNYNLLAVGHAAIDECMANMFSAFMGNVSPNLSACLVSATNDPELQKYELELRDHYRARIYAELHAEGLIWAGHARGTVDEGRHQRLWSKYHRIDRHEFVKVHLCDICSRFAREFMVLHRVSRVLRKCGQYQDLMLLSAGHSVAFTYCDRELYGSAARDAGEPLFVPSEDVENVRGRGFDYTLVLDADTMVEPNSVLAMLEVGAGNPERAIVQPAIQIFCKAGDTFFTHVEAMRQLLNERLTSTLTGILGESGFYGKGLIKNDLYIEKCLGTPEEPIEVVPVDILSHDTFEAAVLQPLYANDIVLKEAPCRNYVTWDIRERRWNHGELVLAMYFFPRVFGKPVRWLQGKLQGKTFEETRVRTTVQFGQTTTYIAHAALRQMLLKPILMVYILLMDFVTMHYDWAPFLTAMFFIIVFPKFVICAEGQNRAFFVEALSSVLQFTPESVVGTIRVLRALKAHLMGSVRWVPQHAVEEEFKRNNPFFFTLSYLWYYPCFAGMAGVMVSSLIPDGMFIMWMLGTLFTLPVYAGFTAARSPSASEASAVPLGEHVPVAARVDSDSDLATRDWLEKVPIGTMGCNLTLPERSQVALARAAYHRRAELVLLDDPFANMDAAAGVHMLEQIASSPLFHGRTRIVAMTLGAAGQHECLKCFDRVILLEAGRIVAQGPPAEVLASQSLDMTSAAASETAACVAGVPATPQLQDRPCDSMHSCGGVLVPEQHGGSSGPRTCFARGIVRVEATVPEAVEALDTDGKPTYWRSAEDALRMGGSRRLLAGAAMVLLLRAAVTLQVLVLGVWADQQELRDQHRTISDDAKYIRVLSSLVFLAGVSQALQNYFVLTFSKAISKSLFETLLWSCLRAPAGSFWARQPPGRMLNRLSSDMLTVDSNLSTGCLALFSFIFSVVLQQVYCLYILPKWLALPMYVAIASFAYFCFTASTPLQYASLFALSTCHEDQLQASISQPTVRAYGLQVAHAAKYRQQASAVVKPNFYGVACAKQWLVLRISFCFCFQCTVCMLAGVLRPSSTHVATLAMIAMLTFNIVQELDGFVDSVIGSIGVGLAIERLSEHVSEEMAPSPERRLAWRARAREAIQARTDLRVQGLRVGETCALNADLGQGTWMGIVGAAGASGPSQVLRTLAGLADADEGCATFGGMILAGLGHADAGAVAQLVRYVPQEPAVFEGSLRFNVDPAGAATHDQLWAALAVAQLGDNSVIGELGCKLRPLSCGQRQLLSLARAVVEEPAVLVLDNCLSAVDAKTRAAAYRALAAALPRTIVLVGAQRPDAVAGFDVVFNLATGASTKQLRAL